MPQSLFDRRLAVDLPPIDLSHLVRPQLAGAFECLSVRDTEIGPVTAYRHRASGATVVTIQDRQALHTFSASVPTRIGDDTGIAHALEHMVLFRSKHARGAADSFTDMRFSGYKIEVGAATTADCTEYPVASLSPVEMRRMMSAYLTRLLAPKFTQQDFELEIGHVGMRRQGKLFTPYLGGVVFHEVRNYFSDPDWHAVHALEQALFPDTHYVFDYGGLPLEVLRLSPEQLEAYWRENYAPSRMLFVLRQPSGIEESLELLDRELAGFEPRGAVVPALPQAPFSAPRKHAVRYPFFGADAADSPRFVQVAWAFAPSDSPARHTQLDLLTEVLAGHEASPLLRELAVRYPQATVGSRLELETRQPYFVVELQGVDVAEASEVRRVLFDELRKIEREGLDPQLLRFVRSSLATKRFDQLHDPAAIPEFFSRLALMHAHGLRLWESFDQQPVIEETTETALREMVRADLLDNPHHVVQTIEPDLELARDYLHAEHELLAARAAAGPDALRSAGARRQSWLRKMRSDSRSEWKSPDLGEVVQPPEIPVDLAPVSASIPGMFRCAIGSRELAGFDLVFDAGHVPEELVQYADLFAGAVLSRFNPRLRREERHLQFAAVLPGAFAHIQFERAPAGVRAYLLVHGRATLEEIPSALEQLRAVCAEPFELGPRMAEALVTQSFRSAHSEWLAEPWATLGSVSSAALSPTWHARDRAEGYEQLRFLRALREQGAVEGHLSERLFEFQKLVLERPLSNCNITCHPAHEARIAAALTEHFGAPSGREHAVLTPTWSPGATLLKLEHSSLSSTSVQSYDLTELDPRQRAQARVLFSLYHHKVLLPQLRTARGAYRVECEFDDDHELPSFVVSRCPRFTAERALGLFENVFSYPREAALQEDTLNAAKRGVVGELDKELLSDPISQGCGTLMDFLAGRTWADWLAFRRAVIETTVDDIRALGERYADAPPPRSAVTAFGRE